MCGGSGDGPQRAGGMCKHGGKAAEIVRKLRKGMRVRDKQEEGGRERKRKREQEEGREKGERELNVVQGKADRGFAEQLQ